MLACLANDEIARVFAHIVLHGHPGDELSPSRRQKAVRALVRGGLVEDRGEGYTFQSRGIKEALADLVSTSGGGGADRSTRWIGADGQISQYPRRRDERAALLQSIGERALETDERVTEAEVNARLERYTSDVPTLRRYLIIHGILAREPDGSAYWRP
ncbi:MULTISPECIES: DUF2087 domain-containing protein [unclassified Microbacterium]|uniref:DUF2087 domain-containing protein n=1 Tax=unclassified Microbacterium TaxID=2609290 RepID=UPI003465428C